MDHLDTLFETGSLKDEGLYKMLKNKLDMLGRKLNSFLDAVQRNHNA
jgi:DNA topoisomerase IB